MKRQSRYKDSRGYIMLGSWLEHRYVWKQANGDIPKGMQIHHINGIKTDNKLSNLALVTSAQNHQKSDRWGKGYQYHKGKNYPYQAQRFLNGKYIKGLGSYGTPCGAIMASRMAYV